MFRFFHTSNQDQFACIRCGERGFCAEATLRIAMMRERSRADRSGGIFSVVVFELEPTLEASAVKMLAKVITERVRFTDVAGWLGQNTLAIILPDTSHAGGLILAQSILHLLSEPTPFTDWQVYTYPAEDENSKKNSPIDRLPQPPPTQPRNTTEDKSSFQSSNQSKDHTLSAETFLNNMLALKTPFWKRTMDVLISGSLLLLLCPVMLLIALAIRISSPGPTIYKQTRVGQAGHDFDCYKFRSMHLNVDTGVHENHLKHLMETDLPMQKLDKGKDPRVFPVGRFIRASSLDELPQLFNVLKGEMSLIGPRPSIPYEYSQFLPWQRHRIDALPGLTGLWQVSGKNKTTFSEMMRFDNRYASRISFGLDMRIVSRTIPVIIGQFLEDRFPGTKRAETEKE